MIAEVECKECQQQNPADAKTCENCGAFINRRSPLFHFAYFYVIAGIIFIALYGYLIDANVARLLTFNWLAVGFALMLIIYGRSRRHASDTAGLLYLAGLALLVIFLVIGVVQIWNSDISLQQLNILPD